MKPVYIVGGVVVLGAVILGVVAFTGTLTPYVSIAEARETSRSVQVHGYLKESLGFDAEDHFRFVLVDDKGDTMAVIYEQPLPANFEQASGFVVIGHYDADAGFFRANKLLVKCPSKYQEQSEEYQEGVQPETTP